LEPAILRRSGYATLQGRTGLGKSQVERVPVGLDSKIRELVRLFDKQAVNLEVPVLHRRRGLLVSVGPPPKRCDGSDRMAR
jgi:hypothetical protein